MKTNENPTVKRAIFSVSDKRGVTGFAMFLHCDFDVEIISTGGTAKAMRDAGIPVTEMSDLTGFPECFDGRVKTLHPAVHGGLLHIRDNPDHRLQAIQNGIKPIDMVVVNLYPFEETVARPEVTYELAIENIDIGGPSMLRSAAKNHRWVVPVSNPSQYTWVQNEMAVFNGKTNLSLRRKLAELVFNETSRYDRAIASYFASHANAVPA